MDFLDITNLAKLIEEQTPISQDDEAVPPPSVTPASLGARSVPDLSPLEKQQQLEKEKALKAKQKNIWDDDEVQSEYFDDPSDNRLKPEYEILFKQKVSAEDVYLGINERNPSSMSCEDLLVKVKLPGHKLADITLDVTRKAVDVRTPKYKLLLPLTREVDHKNGTAEWESDTCTLRIICPIIQDDD